MPKYLSTGTPTYNTSQSHDTASNRNVNMTIIQFLEGFLHDNPNYLPHDQFGNDISVTKFLQSDATVSQQLQNGQRMNIIQFLNDNDISVTKFLNWLQNNTDAQEENMLIIEFLDTQNFLQ